MAIRGLLRLGVVSIRVMDMKLARQHYGERMGLIEVMEDEEGRVGLSSVLDRVVRAWETQPEKIH